MDLKLTRFVRKYTSSFTTIASKIGSYRGAYSRSAPRHQIQAHRIDAVAQARRWRTIREHMPQMCIAFGADHFGTNHAVAHITNLDHGTLAYRLIETRPAAAR